MIAEIEILAKTVFGEASGESFDGQLAVAFVVMNRFKRKFTGDTVTAVCLAPKQFSCWNANDPGPGRIARITSSNRNYQSCMAAAIAAYNGLLPDPTGGADHYFANYIQAPSWTLNMKFTKQIGVHKFYKA